MISKILSSKVIPCVRNRHPPRQIPMGIPSELVKILQVTIFQCDLCRFELILFSDSANANMPYFFTKKNSMLYTDGLCKQGKSYMSTVCTKCYESLSKKLIPKFSPANNVWLGVIPPELQDLTIPEEKLISLYRHNSCIIKLQSPFHSTTTAQTALKGNCITFLQNVSSIATSLPLALDDLSETLTVIFVGHQPPKRLQLKRVLTVRKKKVVEALYWLKKYNPLYNNIKIDLANIAKLPEDDVPESIMSTIEQKTAEEADISERAGYVPDPLSDPNENHTSESVPMANR